ncbi:MAG: 2-phosphosulfolactate phosphatase [Chitinophagales bacterium]|nr:2-phosphosulfolactate phosphatase [Bacteroidota bacterium]MCB9044107.1 2-phosphosulfolactate phosphatase [Chitinophagales bacterium]
MVEVCLSPELIHLYEVKSKIVVVIDILRASSTIVTALESGVVAVRTEADLTACKALETQQYEAAAERNGEPIEGFRWTNSPLQYYQNPESNGIKLALSTTNGTRCVQLSQAADTILIGSFLNLQATAEWLNRQEKDIFLFCAGWKGKVSLEDSLFAGALLCQLSAKPNPQCDASTMVAQLWNLHRDNVTEFLAESAHYKRLNNKGLAEDIQFCFRQNLFTENIVILHEKDFVKQAI